MFTRSPFNTIFGARKNSDYVKFALVLLEIAVAELALSEDLVKFDFIQNAYYCFIS